MKYVPMKKTLTILLMLASLAVFAQETNVANTTYSDSDVEEEMAIRAQMAMTTRDYKVTAGDVYRVAFLAGTKTVDFTFVVDLSYKVRIANLGIVDATETTYLQFKKRVEDLVTRNYPLGGVQVALTAPATFSVYITGEVEATTSTIAWGLTRLSSVLANRAMLTKSASIRDITVRSANGKVTTYDYYRARRFGDLDQDPYLRPGDVVTVNKAARTVVVEGEVNRPGTYQLLDGENLAELLERYGDGFTPVADPARMELVRYVDSESPSGSKQFFDKKALEDNLEIKNLDTVYVPSRQDLIPVMYLEGAIGKSEIDPDTGKTLVTLDSDESRRVPVRFNPGENYASLVRKNAALFTSLSDTKNAYIQREEERLYLNLNPILYDPEYRSDHTVQNGDTLVIPLRQFFVTVTGAVITPGRYPYVPDRDWEYYVALAGGFDKERNSGNALTIRDIQGKERSKSDPIPPEAIIDSKNSSFLYYFNRYSPVVVTVLTAIVSYYTIKDLINGNNNNTD